MLRVCVISEGVNWIMMSGESPSPQSEVIFDLKETAVSHPINVKCMHDKAVQLSPEELYESTSTDTVYHTLAAQELNHTIQIPQAPPSRPTANRRSIENEEAIEQIEEIPLECVTETCPLDAAERGASQSIDVPDGAQSAKEEEEQKPEEDSCIIQCLYYAIQCCDCTIL
ncbi:uncharacterized protein [Periplaneta americana]|uniref:uncharacterized protein isoform X2 n=1 Tax=Periplaneta americana TaxID=6978 RepID=UPI0037E89464